MDENVCEHMKAVIEFAKQTGISMGSCSCCGGLGFYCSVCKKGEDGIERFFEE